MNIRTKLIFAFLIVTVINAGMGLFALDTIQRLSKLANNMYEHALIGGDFSRSAHSNFLKMDRAVTALTHTAGDETAAEFKEEAIAFEEAVREDLSIVNERVQEQEGHEHVAGILGLLGKWESFRESAFATAGEDLKSRLGDRVELFAEIEEAFELLVEYSTEKAFAFRERAADAEAVAVRLQTGAIVLTAAIAILMAVLLARGIGQPVRQMTAVMSELAEGNLDVEVPAIERSDEIGEMAAAMVTFKENAEEMDRLRAERQAERDRSQKELRNNLDRFAADLESALGEAVTQTVDKAEGLNSIAEKMNNAAAEMSASSGEMTVAAETSNASVSSAASAADQVAGSVSEISAKVRRSSEITGEAVTDAGRANEKVDSLSEAAARIGEVLSLITEIADQTNLLALNATIEAARAGEAGKGIAVVASEVKNLANQTARATEEIGEQINGIQTSTKEAAGAIALIGRTISEISEIAGAITTAVEEQDAATRRISRNMEEAARGSMEVSERISVMSGSFDETGRMAGDLNHSANEMAGSMRDLRDEMTRIIRTTVTAV